MKLESLSRSVLLGGPSGFGDAGSGEAGPIDAGPSDSTSGVSGLDGSEFSGELAALCTQLSAQPTEARVLELAAILAPYEAAGQRAREIPETTIGPAEAESLPHCSPRAASLLQRLIVAHGELVPEWLDLAARAGVLAPPTALPDLLSLGRRKKDLRPNLATVAGRRGRWLARLNAEWAYLLDVAPSRPRTETSTTTETDTDETPTEPEARNWHEGSSDQRDAYLRALRKLRPEAARQALEESWSSDNAATRARLLSALEVGLSLGDEAWLEACLDDRSKQVRAAAASLLDQLPESARAGRMLARCRALVHLDRGWLGGSKLRIEVLDPPDAVAQRDGLEAKLPNLGWQRKPLGPGGWILLQIVAATPTDFWRQLGLTPSQLLGLLRNHAWRIPLLAGLSRAAQGQRDAELARALLDSRLDGKFEEDRKNGLEDLGTSTHALLDVLPADERDAYLAADLRRSVDVGKLLQLEQTTPAAPWSEELARAVLTCFRKLMVGPGRHDYMLHSFLRTIAARVPASMLQETLTTVPRPSAPIPSLDEKLSNFAVTLDLRQRLHEEFPS